ncbi:zinc finger protein 37-like [Branchiostoma floridae]|uniref:Zinc finger protein 37-like n=1 Tax=Branchiostoma floridae TaxID=7739 RepID=A0A9J7N4T7_BRAFL|nr:zinc finger protein 37-like [Branchiostoma floridae]
MAAAEAGNGSPTAVPQNVCGGSPTGVLLDRDASKFEDKPTGTKTSLDSHPETHISEKPYKCDQCDYSACNYSAATKNTLDTHLAAKHTGDKPHLCWECGYRTAQKSNLSRHMKTHTREKPYKCDQCDYSAADKSALGHHLAKHTGQTWQRQVMGLLLLFHRTTVMGLLLKLCWTEMQKSTLYLHLAKHSKPFMCGECGHRAARKSQLFRHMRHHTASVQPQRGDQK